MSFLSSLLSAMPGAVAQGLIWGLMAIGVYITFKVLDLADLTVDGTMCTGGAVCIMLMTGGVNFWVALIYAFLAALAVGIILAASGANLGLSILGALAAGGIFFAVLTIFGANIWVAILCAFLVGMLAGAVTGILHTFMGIPAILAGILTQLALYSINLRILGGKANQAINPDKYTLLVSLRNVKAFAIRNPIIVVALFTVVIIAILYWFFGTALGCSIRATGANENMSRAQGINVNMTKVLGLMLSNGLVAVASALYAQYQGFADVNAGRGAIVIGLAAVIIGEVVFSRIFRNFALKLLSVALGAVIYYLVIQVVLTLGLNSNDLKLLSAAVVAVFLAVPYWKGRYLKASAKPAAEEKEGE